jgi:hypothetical protein
MVATILIVAIAVVLAAVVFFIASSLVHTVGAAPLGSEFGWGAAINDTGSPTAGCASLGHYCYHIDIAWAGSDFRTSSMTLGLQNLAGSPVAWPASITGAGGTVKLIGSASSTVLANYWVTNATWQFIPPFSSVINSGYSIVVYAGGAPEGAGQGLTNLELVAIGVGGYSGTVSSAPFT